MRESEPSSAPTSICGFFTTIKLTPGAEPQGSAGSQDPGVRTPAEAWTIRVAVLCRCRATHIGDRETDISRVKATQRCAKTYTIYRKAMLTLLDWPKPAFDQLAVELPILMGFRPEEVGTWKAEYIDWQNGDTLVLDAKKHRLYLVPMSTDAARHAEEVLNGRSSGYVLYSRSNAWQRRDTPLTPAAIWNIWHKWIQLADLRVPGPVSPLVGRRFFAAEWYYRRGLSLVTLQRILRHTHFETTVRYVQSLVFHEDIKRDYDRFQAGLRRETAPEARV